MTDGLEFAAEEEFSPLKMNAKTKLVGKGSQLNLVTTTYAGQSAFCKETGNGFRKEKLSNRDSTNTNWITPQVSETSEQTTSIGNVSSVSSAGNKHYLFYTLPSTEKWYVFTALEYYGSTGGSPSNIMMGVDLVNADPPTLSHSVLVALCPESTGSGLTKVSTIYSRPIRGGTLVGLWVENSTSTATGIALITPTPSNPRSRTTVYSTTPKMADATAWNVTGSSYYINGYFRGYN